MKLVFIKKLMEMLKTKNLEEITITDLTNKCGVSRQAFYYYFNDIYEVVEYIFVEETDKEIREFTNVENWSLGYIKLMKWAKENKHIIMNIYNSVAKEYIENFMNSVLYQYIIKVVKNEAIGLNVLDEQCEFIANFYTMALNSISLDWISKHMKEEPEEIAKKVNFLLDGNFKKALLKFQKENESKK